MDDVQELIQQLEALEIKNEAWEIRLDAYGMTEPNRHAELLHRYEKEYAEQKSGTQQDDPASEVLSELEERIERSRQRRVYFVIQKPVDEYHEFIKRPYRRKKQEPEPPKVEEPRELTYEEQLAKGPMGSGINDAKKIGQFFLDHEMVSVDGLISHTGESRTIVNYYLRLFKSRGYIWYIAEDKYYTANDAGRVYFSELLGE